MDAKILHGWSLNILLLLVDSLKALLLVASIDMTVESWIVIGC